MVSTRAEKGKGASHDLQGAGCAQLAGAVRTPRPTTGFPGWRAVPPSKTPCVRFALTSDSGRA